MHLASVICGNELVYYGIHALSMAYAVLGKGAVSAINVGKPGANIARIRFGGKRDVVLIVGEKEEADGNISVRKQGEGDQGAMSIGDFAAMIQAQSPKASALRARVIRSKSRRHD